MDDLALAFEAAVVGRSCRVERREADWAFDLLNKTGLAVGCHWRLVSPDGIVLTDEDHGQRFGLPEPVDAELRRTPCLPGRPFPLRRLTERLLTCVSGSQTTCVSTWSITPRATKAGGGVSTTAATKLPSSRWAEAASLSSNVRNGSERTVA